MTNKVPILFLIAMLVATVLFCFIPDVKAVHIIIFLGGWAATIGMITKNRKNKDK
ncbi:MAG: hypothetical protein KF706_02275 [Chitinophagales bacterium]|nr:hypothetical protein [Chitinophagales bacterium]